MTDIIYKTDRDEHHINTGKMEDPEEAYIREMYRDEWFFAELDAYNSEIKDTQDYRAYE